ncbi:glutamate receptor ionotropic, kainate 2 [Manduca sexta]|uniref:glutamate receptor ionotropic, kainate 2 n=1 Tax=Manduca sexta TaxID=7130 RepID=UPI0018909C10|nr:glutamate receptor ionotropic, kainate 2 [Manduca sexta]
MWHMHSLHEPIGAMRFMTLILFVVAGSTLAQPARIGVVELQPILARQLAAAAEAALQSLPDAGVTVQVAGVEPDEPLSLAAHLCAQAREGVAAVLSAGGERAARLAGAAAARAGVPLLLLDEAPADGSWEALPLYPHPDVLAQACADLCKEKGWRRAVVLHEGGAAGAALIAPDGEPLALLARQLPPPSEPALLRSLLLVLKRLGVTNFIVWCEAACCERVLDAAQRVGLLSDRHSYIMLSLDLHTRDLEPYSHGGANVTALRLFDPESEHVQNMMAAWQASYLQQLGEPGDAGDATDVERIAAAPPAALPLAYQATALATEALSRLRLPTAGGASCERGLGAFHADTLLNYLRSEEWVSGAGAGGEVSWETDGARREVQLQVAELVRGGRLQHAGVWAPSAKVTWQRAEAPPDTRPLDSMTNRTFAVLVALNKPYVMRQESTLRLSGNEQYEGFCIELIEKLSKMLKFNYTFVEQVDGSYGSYDNATNRWTGMIGRLMTDPNIDFAVTDLTITSEREKAVDFTTPFMNLGIAILFRKPKPPEPKLFAFLLPFSNGVWICLGFAYLGTSLLLYVVGRLCHEEWQNPYPCIEDPPALENQFTLANALWFNLGAVLLQGSEIAPVAYGTRAVASMWWLFALVITSSYTANLATLLATKSTTELIHNVNELANNKLGIKFGAKANGSTHLFFKNSQNEMFQKMYEDMSHWSMPTSNDEGIKKVATEDFAFLMESTSIDYVTERNCNVTKVGDMLDSKGYGIAMKKDSRYRQGLNLALLNLQEAGTLREMINTWWNERNGGGACKDVEEYENEKLRMANFWGLFLVLVVGCALGVVVSCADLAYAALRSKRPAQRGNTFAARFWDELRFVFRFDQSVKPVQGPLIKSPSSSPRSESCGEESPEEAAVTEGAHTAREGTTGTEGAGGSEEPAEERWLRPGSAGARSARRRSSMHAANARLARHAPSHSATPARR